MTVLDIELVTEIGRALEHDEFVLHYQPEVDLSSGQVVGMEALLRWRHPVRGMLWPGEFMPAAEASGYLPELDAWVIAECLREANAWARLAPRVRAGKQLWLNISGAKLAQPDFAERLAGGLADSGVPAGVLGIEITESALGPDMEMAAKRLTALKEAGYGVALDDFGTWYSALSHLDELPLDQVKLDQRFVRGVGADLDDDAIVASVIRLAHAHGLQVVAEGVESWSEGARLCELECDRALGYLFAGPQPADRARVLLARGVGWQAPVVEMPDARPGE